MKTSRLQDIDVVRTTPCSEFGQRTGPVGEFGPDLPEHADALPRGNVLPLCVPPVAPPGPACYARVNLLTRPTSTIPADQTLPAAQCEGLTGSLVRCTGDRRPGVPVGIGGDARGGQGGNEAGWRVCRGWAGRFQRGSFPADRSTSGDLGQLLAARDRQFRLPCRFRGCTRARLATLGTVQPRNRPHNDHPVHKVDLTPPPEADLPIGSRGLGGGGEGGGEARCTDGRVVVSRRGHLGEVASLNAGRSGGAWPTTTRSSVRRVFPGDSIKQPSPDLGHLIETADTTPDVRTPHRVTPQPPEPTDRTAAPGPYHPHTQHKSRISPAVAPSPSLI